MQILRLSFLLLLLGGFALAQDIDIEIKVTPPKEARPGDFITHVFIVKNLSATEETFRLSLEASEGLILISSIPPQVTLKPGGETKLFVTVQLSKLIKAGRYFITLTAGGAQAQAVIDVIRVLAVEVIAPEGRKVQAGKSITYSFIVINHSNDQEEFLISATASLGRVNFERSVTLKMGERREVLVTLDIPEDAPPEDRIALWFRVEASRQRDVFAEAAVFTVVLPRPYRLEEEELTDGIKGLVFIDQNLNGRPGPDEEGVSGVIVIATQPQEEKRFISITDEEGRYLIPDIKRPENFDDLVSLLKFMVAKDPKEFEIEIDRASLPLGFQPAVQMPLKITLANRQIKEVNIPLVRVGRIEGSVFIDLNKDGKRDPTEEGVGGIRVMLWALERALETLTAGDGRYVFLEVPPGRYELKIDETTLPEDLILVSATQALNLGSGEVLTVDFPLLREEKRIIFWIPPIGDSPNPPGDLDGDGLYEDVDGDGKLTHNDPMHLAFNLDSEVVQAHKSAFDFDGDGDVDFDDTKALAAMIPD
jgi:hypothetical protein